MSNLFPTDKILQRADKERLLNQKGMAIWLTGLSGSGKTTLAVALEKELFSKGLNTKVLDGDNIRNGINNNLGFSQQDRIENIRRIAEIAKLFVHSGIITICCFISPTEEIRNLAKTIIGKDDFLEVFVNAPLNVCEKRDVNGLYAKARNGEIKDFTGIDSPYEVPVDPSVILNTDELPVKECVKKILETLPY
jgi:adenylylsulfate kinase